MANEPVKEISTMWRTVSMSVVLSVSVLLAGAKSAAAGHCGSTSSYDDPDFDCDGDVDITDLLIWQVGFPTSSGASHADGDADGDYDVDATDLMVWAGAYPSPATASASSVPEPAGWMIPDETQSLNLIDLNVDSAAADTMTIIASDDCNSIYSADFDCDGDRDVTDLLIWQAGFPTPSGATRGDGDADQDGDVDATDLLMWQHRGCEFSADFCDSASASAVPEPAGSVMIGIVLLSMWGVRRPRGGEMRRSHTIA